MISESVSEVCFLQKVNTAENYRPSILHVQTRYINPFSVYTIFNFPLIYRDACTERGRTLIYRLVPACSKISNAKKKFTTIPCLYILCLYIPPIYLYCYVELNHNQVLIKMLWIKWRIFSDITDICDISSVIFLLC